MGTPKEATEAGTAIILVTDSAGASEEVTVHYAKVDVDAPVNSVSVAPTAVQIAAGETAQLSATVLPADATITDVIFASKDTAVAAVDSETLSKTENVSKITVKGVAPGKTTVTATTKQGKLTSSSAVTVIEATPAAVHGTDETGLYLTGLVAGAAYTVDGTEYTADASGKITKLPKTLLGKTVSVIKTNSDADLNSKPQPLDLTAVKLPLTETVVSVTGLEKTCTGAEQEPTFGGSLVRNTDYTVSYAVKTGEAGALGTNGKPQAAGTYVVTVTGKGDYEGSFTKEMTIEKQAGPAAPTDLVPEAASAKGASDGKIRNVTTAMEYSTTSDFATATDCTDTTITELKAGDYYIRVAETETTEAGAYEIVSVPDGPGAFVADVTIAGSLKYGETLTVSVDIHSDDSQISDLSYQWKRGGESISEATESTYELVQADIGQTISCEVKSNVETGTVTGTASAKVEKADGPGAPTEAVGIATSEEGASDGKIINVNDSMQYASDTDFTDAKDISGTTVIGLKAGPYYVRVKETATNKAGAPATVNVADGPNAFSGTVTITGNLKYNETLTAVVTGANDGETLSYQWMRGENEIADATSSTYKTVQADIGQTIKCVVSSDVRTGNIEGMAGALIDKADSPEAPADLTPTATTVKGEADGKIGNTTTAMQYATKEDFSDSKEVEGTEITGLAAGTYYVRLKETATTKAGKAQSVTVEDGPAILTGTVTISGSAKYNETLTATVTDTNNSGTLKYQWKRGGEAIDGETSSTYKLTQADIGQTISCEVTSTKELKSITGMMSGKVEKADNPVVPSGLIGVAPTVKGESDGKIQNTTTVMQYATKEDFSDSKEVEGTEIIGLAAGTYYVRLKETATTKAGKAQTVTVEDGPEILTGTVTITGTLRSGETLTATVTGSNNSGTLKYQWKRDGVAIGGASDAQYQLGQLDIGKTISCEVTGTVEAGSISGTSGAKVEEATETENDSPIVDTSDEEDDDDYVPTTDRGNQSSNLPIINKTGTRMVVTSGMGAAKIAAGIANDDYLEVEMTSLSADTQAAQMIRQFAADRNLSIADYFDVNVYRVTANGVRVSRITEFAAPIDLMFEAPEGVDPAQYDISVLRLHNGVVNQLKDKDNDPITVTVATDRCSAYVLVYGAKDGTAAATNGKKTINSTASGISKNASPKTYDASKYVPAAAETEIAEFVQKQSEKLPEQAAADLLITPQAAPFPMGIVIALLLFMVAFIGGEYVYFKRKERK